jgi:hypothetical protein
VERVEEWSSGGLEWWSAGAWQEVPGKAPSLRDISQQALLAHSATPELLQLLNSFFKEYLPPLRAYSPLPLEEPKVETFDSSNARHECK